MSEMASLAQGFLRHLLHQMQGLLPSPSDSSCPKLGQVFGGRAESISLASKTQGRVEAQMISYFFSFCACFLRLSWQQS